MSETESLDPAGAQQRIAGLKNDTEFVNRFVAGNVDAVHEMNRLHEIAYPTKEQAENETGEPVVTAPEFDEKIPPAKPEDYQFPSLVNDRGEHTQELAEFDQVARGWLSAGQFPKEAGSFIAKEIDRVANDLRSMTDNQKEMWAQDQVSQLKKMWGDQFNLKIALAQQLVNEIEMKTPGLKSFLEDSGAGNSALIAAQVAFHAERLMAIRGK